MNNIIYCGRKSVGKSTYLQSLSTDYVDFDEFIWYHFRNEAVDSLKRKIAIAIKETNFRSYRRHLAFISEQVDWNKLIESANKISTTFEMPALGMWWDLIPHKLRYNSFIFKVDCTDDVRIKRAKKRGCLDTLKQFDLFYRDPPIIHNTVMV